MFGVDRFGSRSVRGDEPLCADNTTALRGRD